MQFAIDGDPIGPAHMQADADPPYTYSTTLSLDGIEDGPHKLTVVATEHAGKKVTSAPTDSTIDKTPPVGFTIAPSATSVSRALNVQGGRVGCVRHRIRPVRRRRGQPRRR